MAYAKIVNGKVIQKQPNEEPGFVHVDDSVVCGQVTSDNKVFFNPSISIKNLILNQISLLEKTQTPRRIRDSLLGTDNGWMADLEKQITELRSQLENLK